MAIPNDSLFQSLKNSFISNAHAVAEAVVPVLTTSRFAEAGVLTPQEFVEAGDFLCSKCPTWQWSSGDPDKRRPYLPERKQFLVTKGVPCRCRVRALERDVEGDERDAGDGWVATSHAHAHAGGADEYTALEDAVRGPGAAAAAPAAAAASAPATAAKDDDDYIDLDDFEDAGLAGLGDMSTLTSAVGEAAAAAAAPAPAKAAAPSDDDGILRTRTYDLSITYDKYYQCPRMWLAGYDEAGRPLPPSAVFEDISSDHANKTATIDPHPHLSLQCASIHPCRHASTMKKIYDGSFMGTGPARVDMALFLFLKFMQAIIPAISYDVNAVL